MRTYPAGVDLNVGDSIVSARLRESLKTSKPLDAEKRYEFTIELYPTSLVFRSGHRIRVDMDPLSLRCRLATSVPLPCFHTIHYAGVLAAASPWRSRLKPPQPPTAEDVEPEKRVRKSGYRPWTELLQRTFAVDVLTCPSCQGRMRLLAVVKNPAGMARGQASRSPAAWRPLAS